MSEIANRREWHGLRYYVSPPTCYPIHVVVYGAEESEVSATFFTRVEARVWLKRMALTLGCDCPLYGLPEIM